MFKSCRHVLGAIGAALLLASAPAYAVPITGAVSVSDTLVTAGFLPCVGGGIVRNCTSVAHLGFGNTGGGTLDFVGTGGAANATLLDWVFATPGLLADEISIPGFAFDITAAGPIIQGPLVCLLGGCSDSLIVVISGVVTGAGFDPTIFGGTLTLTGSCSGTPLGGDCNPLASFSGGYSYSLSSSGIVLVPEPGTLLLIGIALAGLGFVRRRSS